MKTFWHSAVLAVLAGCAPMDPLAYREDPNAFSNPALLRCASGTAPVCEVWGGRTRKEYSSCRCRRVGGPT